MILEIGATIFGLIQGVLVMFNKRSNWIFYILQMLFLIMFSSINHLYGDIVNNSIYFVMGIIGFILWNKADSSKITNVVLKERVAYIIFIILGTIGITLLLKSTDDPLPLLDAFTTVSSLVATYYMMRRKLDTWIIWFINDIFYAVEYFLLPNQALYLFALNIVWTFMAVVSYVKWKKIMEEENTRIKMFYSGTYKVRHEFINKDNICEMLQDDVRSKIVGNVKDTVYASDGVMLKENQNVMYIGGFYYEKEHPNKSACENVVYEELKQIDHCDLVIANLMNYSAIASITEIIYAASKNKKVVIFCDPKVTKYDVEGEYWFPILAAKEICNKIEVKFVENENDIVEYVNNLGKVV